MEIREGGLDDAQVAALIEEHLRFAAQFSPPESIHAMGLEALKSPSITFYTAWEGETLLGCGALKELDPAHGELKSMRTATGHLRKGVAARILGHMIQEASARGYERLSLETGSDEAFAPARALYARFGFTVCGPFGGYAEDPFSVFMTRAL